ncbi:thioesterase II family protein [Streptomyces sp. NPDC001691]|uniref:thioesterase II family protein n=1 Tax=Streptomyces sp. NPDC001691 TaxID=3364600 RepID=UPI003696FB7C
MSEHPAGGVLVCFPAAGGGGTTLAQLRDAAVRRGLTPLALSNADSVDDFDSGRWREHTVSEIGRAVDRTPGGRIVLAGHSMGGLSAVCLHSGPGARIGTPSGVLVINTPCPDSSGRIPTMSHLPDREIKQVLAHDGFPQELLDDEDMLAEIAHGLRADAVVADRLAEWIASHGPRPDRLHVLSGRDDRFIPTARCAAWRDRVSGDFQLTLAPGGHSLDGTGAAVLERVLDGLLTTTTPSEEGQA